MYLKESSMKVLKAQIGITKKFVGLICKTHLSKQRSVCDEFTFSWQNTDFFAQVMPSRCIIVLYLGKIMSYLSASLHLPLARVL